MGFIIKPLQRVVLFLLGQYLIPSRPIFPNKYNLVFVWVLLSNPLVGSVTLLGQYLVLSRLIFLNRYNLVLYGFYYQTHQRVVLFCWAVSHFKPPIFLNRYKPVFVQVLLSNPLVGSVTFVEAVSRSELLYFSKQI